MTSMIAPFIIEKFMRDMGYRDCDYVITPLTLEFTAAGTKLISIDDRNVWYFYVMWNQNFSPVANTWEILSDENRQTGNFQQVNTATGFEHRGKISVTVAGVDFPCYLPFLKVHVKTPPTANEL